MPTIGNPSFGGGAPEAGTGRAEAARGVRFAAFPLFFGGGLTRFFGFRALAKLPPTSIRGAVRTSRSRHSMKRTRRRRQLRDLRLDPLLDLLEQEAPQAESGL